MGWGGGRNRGTEKEVDVRQSNGIRGRVFSYLFLPSNFLIMPCSYSAVFVVVTFIYIGQL